MGNVYSIGKSALLSANYAISVTDHNIANAGTAGYNRQVILQSNIHGQQFGFGFVGNGVRLDDIRRVYDEFLGKQFIDTQGEYSRLSTYYNQVSKINNKLADDTAGVSPALQSFFGSVQETAATPTSAATREATLSEAQMLAGRYNNLAKQLEEQRDLANAQVINSVELINTYAIEIAKLNDQIARAQISLADPAPNDLLDQRDHLISQVAQEIGVRTVENGNSLDVYIGNGQPLVINGTSFSMFARYSAADPKTVEVGYVNNHIDVVIPDRLLTGGNLMGYKDFMKNEVDPILNELGRVAATLVTDFNEQHRLGIDLNGERGGDFFNATLTSSAPASISGGSVGTKVVNTDKLQASNYEVKFVGGEYTIARQSDGKIFANGSVIDDGSTWDGSTMPVTIDGLEFSIGGAWVPGDMAVVRPLGEVASSMKVLITDTNKIAAALPLRTARGENNLGTGEVSLGDLVALNDPDGVNVPAVPPALNLTVSVDATGKRWIEPSRTVTVTNPDGTPGGTFTPSTPPAPPVSFEYKEGMTIALGDFTFNITGNLEAGDTFSVESNVGGTGDNRNMLALANLQDAKTMLGGTTTYQGTISQLVNRVGAKTRELEITSTSTGNLLNEIYDEQQSQSGVNLDEEAINLMRYQQNYNAASKVLQSANEMFDAILAIF